MPRQKVVMRPSGLPLREPDTRCEACGARGTVGRAMRTDAAGVPTEIHRFCAPCWPENAARFQARWNEETRLATEAWLRAPDRTPQPAAKGAAFESATWHNALAIVREITLALRQSEPPTPEDLAAFAEQLRAAAPELEGQMPFEIHAFIQAYGAPAG